MADLKDSTINHYLSDLGKLLRESAFEVKQCRDSAKGSDRDFENGRLMAYNEVISLMQGQAIAFQLTLKEIGLDNVDPDNDLV